MQKIIVPVLDEELILSPDDWGRIETGHEAKFSYTTKTYNIIPFTVKKVNSKDAIKEINNLLHDIDMILLIIDHKEFTIMDGKRLLSMNAESLYSYIRMDQILQMFTEDNIYEFYPMGHNILIIKWPFLS